MLIWDHCNWALLLAKNIAPWSHRNFAFEKFSRFDQHLWNKLKEEAKSKIFDGHYQIYASDMDPHMIRIAKDKKVSKIWLLNFFMNRSLDYLKSSLWKKNRSFWPQISIWGGLFKFWWEYFWRYHYKLWSSKTKYGKANFQTDF